MKQNGSSVTGTVKFTEKNGQQESDGYRFTLVKQGDTFLIDDFGQTSGGG